MSENRLKPCPFCGGEAELLYEDDCNSDRLWRVECKECDCCTSEYYKNAGKEHAIRAWNTRKPMERIVEQLNKRIEDDGRIMVENPADKLDEIANNAAEDFIQAYEECIELIEKDGAE